MFIVITILLAFIVQIQILPILGLRLDILLFITLFYGFLYGWKTGAGVGLIIGLLQDIFSGGMLGLSSVGLIACGILAGYTRGMLLLRYWIVRVSLVFILTILNLLIYFGLSIIFSQNPFCSFFKTRWLLISFENTILAGVVFWLVDRYG